MRLKPIYPTRVRLLGRKSEEVRYFRIFGDYNIIENPNKIDIATSMINSSKLFLKDEKVIKHPLKVNLVSIFNSEFILCIHHARSIDVCIIHLDYNDMLVDSTPIVSILRGGIYTESGDYDMDMYIKSILDSLNYMGYMPSIKEIKQK